MTNLNFLKIWHRAFARHIEYLVEGTDATSLSPDIVADATTCQFGKWAISPPQELRDDPEFGALLAVHAQFHKIAAQLLQMYVDGNQLAVQAQRLDLIASSESFVLAVDELEKSLNEGRAGSDPNTARLKPALAATTWDKSLLVGINVLDEQHEGIVKIADEFLAAPRERLSSERGRQLLENVEKLLALHFATEEQYMARAKMPEEEIKAHKADHTEILNRFVSITYELALLDKDMSFGDMHSLLQKSVIEHVVTVDVKLPKAITSR